MEYRLIDGYKPLNSFSGVWKNLRLWWGTKNYEAMVGYEIFHGLGGVRKFLGVFYWGAKNFSEILVG